MRIAITKANETHYPEKEGEFTCPITGPWEVWQCPDCSYRVQLSQSGRRPIKLDRGITLTDEQVAEHLDLHRCGEHGQANAMVAAIPAHKIGAGKGLITGLSVRAS